MGVLSSSIAGDVALYLGPLKHALSTFYRSKTSAAVIPCFTCSHAMPRSLALLVGCYVCVVPGLMLILLKLAFVWDGSDREDRASHWGWTRWPLEVPGIAPIMASGPMIHGYMLWLAWFGLYIRDVRSLI